MAVVVRLLAALFIAALALGACARTDPDSGGRDVIAVAQLPAEARQTLALIRQGGPFPFRKDGDTFFNRERLLPPRPRGYYTEYTVRTPASRDRGPRRIVAGQGTSGNPATSGEYWYTEDHYQTFRRIRE